MKLPTNWPVIVKKQNATVKIYHSKSGGYDEFKLVFYDPTGKRRFKTFADFEAAKMEAGKVAATLTRSDADGLTLSSTDKIAYVRAVDALKGTGLAIDVAAYQFAEAWTAASGSVIEAARYYAKKHPAKLPRKSVDEVLTEFIDAKEKAGRSEDYLADLRYRCGRFAESFQCAITDVTGVEIRQFLAELNLSGRSVNNFRLAIGTLCEFAKARGYLPKDFDELDGIDTADEGEGAIEIFIPKEMVALLNAARPDFLPVLAIAAFAGLRAKEIERLDWSEVKLDRGFIEVKATKAKTAARRLVPILDNLKAWLAPYSQQTGPVWPHSEAWFEQSKRETAERVKVQWKHNALRHSYISYRVADIQNVNQVALEAGNSPAMIFKNYRELVTPDEAKVWFSINPEPVANVAPMPTAATV